MIDETGDAVYIPTPEDEAEWDRLHFYGMALDAALAIRPRAQGMSDHVIAYKAVSKIIIACVIGGEQYIARIWDARTQGTHGITSHQLTIERYDMAGQDRPLDTSGKLPSCLTAEELANANKAAQEFGDWLEDHKPVNFIIASQKFQEIGERHQSSDNTITFVWSLKEAVRILELLRKAGM